MNKTIRVLNVLLAAVIGIVPRFLACSTAKVTMDCHWTVQAEIAVSIPLLISGMVILITRGKEYWRSASIIGIALGISVILIPSVLIGVCPSPMMECHNLMRPLLIVFGALTIISNGGLLIYSFKK